MRTTIVVVDGSEHVVGRIEGNSSAANPWESQLSETRADCEEAVFVAGVDLYRASETNTVAGFRPSMFGVTEEDASALSARVAQKVCQSNNASELSDYTQAASIFSNVYTTTRRSAHDLAELGRAALEVANHPFDAPDSALDRLSNAVASFLPWKD